MIFSLDKVRLNRKHITMATQDLMLQNFHMQNSQHETTRQDLYAAKAAK